MPLTSAASSPSLAAVTISITFVHGIQPNFNVD
jgi:hypothetical protein